MGGGRRWLRRSNSRLKAVFGLAQAAAIPRREGSNLSKITAQFLRGGRTWRRAGAGPGTPGLGTAGRSSAFPPRAWPRAGGERPEFHRKLTAWRRARRLQSGAGGRVASYPEPSGRGGLSFGAVAAAGSPSARRVGAAAVKLERGVRAARGRPPAGGLCLSLQPHRRVDEAWLGGSRCS